MAAIASEVEVAGRAEEVFSYVTDPSRFPEWQQGVVSGRMEGGGTHGVGAKCITTRRIGGAERAATSEVTEMSPPRRWAVRGLDGPIRAIVNVRVEPLSESAHSRVTIEVDFEGHGIGKLLVPLVVRRQAAKEMPENMKALRERLESAG
ncbi:MAG: SRPBCC family protein [Solirubrobacteraceae bacterium]